MSEHPPRLIIGVDPGPTPGLAAAWFWQPGTQCTWLDAEFGFAQSDPDTMVDLLLGWTREFLSESIVIATETYVVSNRSSRSSHSSAREATQAVLDRVKNFADEERIARVTRPAGIVKPWATNERLNAVGFLSRTTGSTHARDASRHMLYAGVHDVGLPDPFSKKTSKKE